MANHVYCDISLVEGNKTSTKRFNEAFRSVKRLDECGLEYSNIMPEWDGEFASYGWMNDNVGPKWANLEAYDEDEIDEYVHVCSAWCAPFQFMETLGEHLSEVDADVKLKMTYVDEFYNFVGVWTWANGVSEVEEVDGEYLIKMRAEQLRIPSKNYKIFDDDGWHDFLDDIMHQWASEYLDD